MAHYVVGVSRGDNSGIMGAWWWNDEVKAKIREKKVAYTELVEHSSDAEKDNNRVKYKLTKKEAKKAVAISMNKAYEKLYQRLETKDG